MIDPGRLITAMVTPFDDKGNLSKERALRLVAHLIDTGTDCILVSGTTGESPTISDEEKLDLLGWVKSEVPNGYPVIFGAGTNNTGKSIDLAKKAVDKGADILLLVVPYYNKPPQAGMFEHFSQIACESKIPSILYNIPSRTGVNLSPGTVIDLAKNEYIIGIKEASGNLDIVSEIRNDTSDDFLIYSGDDSLTLPMLSIGCYGVISVASHLVGKKIKTMINSYLNGHPENAKSIHLELFRLFKGLFISTNPIPVKESLNLMGQDVGNVRAPLVPCNADERQKLTSLLKEYNLV